MSKVINIFEATAASETADIEAPEEATGRNCLNCGTPLTDAFCPHCGQKASVGRLNIKTAVIDNTWSALRMDGRVLPTAWMLVTRPWVVVRDYIHGRRVVYTQPVRFIVIMCFVSILVQIFFPDAEVGQAAAHTATAGEAVKLRLWASVQEFLRESEVAVDLIDSVVFAPIIYLIYLRWGSRRYNIAEYSTAYLYLCGANLVIDLILLPLHALNDDVSTLVQLFWWIFIIYGMVKRAFTIEHAYTRALLLMVSVAAIVAAAVFTHIVILAEPI